jgi:hypothetical protein
MDPLTAPALPGVRFRWPPAFHSLPVAPGDSADRLLAVLFPHTPEYDEVRAAARTFWGSLAGIQRDAGIFAAGLCNGRLDERVTGAYVSLSLVPLDYESAEVAALGMHGVLAGATEDADEVGGVLREGTYVVGVRLPAGPAVVTTELREVGAGPTVPVGVLQVRLPAPGYQALLVVTLMTPALEDFTAYCQDGAALAASVRFLPPDPDRGPEEPPTGLLGTAALPFRGT